MFKSISMFCILSAMVALGNWTVDGISLGGSAESGVPYTGASSDLDLGTYRLKAAEFSQADYIYLTGGPGSAAYWKINNDAAGNLINSGRHGWAMRMGDDGVFDDWGLYTSENWGIPVLASWYSRGVSVNQHIDHGAGLDVLKDNEDFYCTGGYGANIVMRNSLFNGQNILLSLIDGNTVSKWRTDFAGNTSWAAWGVHDFYVGGDFGTGTLALELNSSGNALFGVSDDYTHRVQVQGGIKTDFMKASEVMIGESWKITLDENDNLLIQHFDGMYWNTRQTITPN